MKSKASKKQNLICYALLGPWFLLFTIFTLIPILASVVISFTDFNMVQKPGFVGLSNYLRLLLEDDVFIIALKNTLLFALITGPAGYILSFVIAWFINDLGRKTRSFFTLLFYTPTLAGSAYMVWSILFNGSSYGLINSFLLQWNIIKEPLNWLNDTKYNFTVCIIVILWMSMGAGFLAFVAGFKQLDKSLFEAAAIDGIKNRWQELWYITLPQMSPQLLIGAVFSISGAFAVGAQNAALTGFPSTDYSTHTLVLHMLDFGNIRFEVGYASAIAVVLFGLMVLVWYLINAFLRRFSID